MLEGTYPYVAGGVSTWVHQLITSMKDIRFGIVYIAAHSDPTRELKYEVPNNVIYLKELDLHDYDLENFRGRNPTKKDYEKIRMVYEDLAGGKYDRLEPLLELFQGEGACFDGPTIFTAKEVWDLLVYFYDRFADDVSFIDYFWTWRGIHLPLMQIVRAEIPRAKIYHAVSTGYAGLLGSIAKMVYKQKFFLTEHGIYTHERVLEISQANWIYEQEKRNYRAERDLSFFKQWWISTFRVMSRVSYAYADRIFTLFEGNKVRETLEGADPEKITIIPNGINIKDYQSIVRDKKEKPQIALIGRVVNIKDIKTFLQAARLVLGKIPDAEFFVLGPTTEEEDYFEECKMLVDALHMENKITFTGNVDVRVYLKSLDLVVLTSLSEAQPYVILEANIVGIPVVATDVGACREMLEGHGLEDRMLGPSGLVTEVSNPLATANAIVHLMTDKLFYGQC
ncbi:MAG: GT4 family glycosyltransferase PelF, partial [Deltaproteobacteria bacterium]|nr:GT4 family glycosyltransferase PelF [Deltaproteobacteria bacterium]